MGSKGPPALPPILPGGLGGGAPQLLGGSGVAEPPGDMPHGPRMCWPDPEPQGTPSHTFCHQMGHHATSWHMGIEVLHRNSTQNPGPNVPNGGMATHLLAKRGLLGFRAQPAHPAGGRRAGGRAVAPTLTPLVSTPTHTHTPKIAIPLLGGGQVVGDHGQLDAAEQ